MNSLLELDKTVFLWLHQWVGKNELLDEVWKVLAVYLVYTIPIFLFLAWFTTKRTREASLRAVVSGALGWLVLTPLISHLWFRQRPFIDTFDSKELIFHRPTYSFPSDHALFSFAIASSFYLAGHKKIASGLYVVAFLISFSRVVAGVHFPLDIIVGGLLGFALSFLFWHYRKNFDMFYVKPLITLAKVLHLDWTV